MLRELLHRKPPDDVHNCLTCGTGSHWWLPQLGGFWKCPECEGNPLKAGSGRQDYALHGRWRMINQFGPRLPGDELLRGQEIPAKTRYAEWARANPDKVPTQMSLDSFLGGW